MLPSNIVGKKYETMASYHLEQKGYKILERNHKNVLGEIDLICRQEDIIVFVEVKYRQSAKFGRPIEAITPNKIFKIKKTAMLYLKQKRLLGNNIRFDVIEILDEEIRHLEGCF